LKLYFIEVSLLTADIPNFVHSFPVKKIKELIKMLVAKQIAKHFREVHWGGNWTCSNLKDHLADVTWQQATTQVYSFNTIATLVYHINFYVDAVLHFMETGKLEASDKFSFDLPPIKSEKDWQNLTNKMFTQAEKFANLIEQMPESKLWEILSEEKYGNYYRNLHGIIEHTHYHLGQIALIKKIVSENEQRTT
jgi:hypothetical protein